MEETLTTKQKLFVEAYLTTLNGTEAAARAKYKGNRATLAAVGSENLQKSYIRLAIERKLADIHASTGVSVEKLEKHLARNFSRQVADSRIGVVYFLRADNGLTKIGRTMNMGQRFKVFSTHLPYELEVVRLIHSDNCHELERRLHLRFADKRVRGEWFNVTQDDIEGCE